MQHIFYSAIDVSCKNYCKKSVKSVDIVKSIHYNIR